MSLKNSSDTIRSQTHDLPAGGAVPQPTALPRAPLKHMWLPTFAVLLCKPVTYNKDSLYVAICR